MEAPKRVEIVKDKIVIREKVQFELNKAIIKSASHDLLNEVVSIVKKNDHVKKVRVEGHASSEGSKAHNDYLASQRAKAVMNYLIEKGISKDRLESKGVGSSKPIADNDTAAGRVANRRVEFNILEQDTGAKGN